MRKTGDGTGTQARIADEIVSVAKHDAVTHDVYPGQSKEHLVTVVVREVASFTFSYAALPFFVCPLPVWLPSHLPSERFLSCKSSNNQ